jgi:hypothetical protein
MKKQMNIAGPVVAAQILGTPGAFAGAPLYAHA